MPIPQPLKRIFEVYCHVNATNVETLAEHCKLSNWSYSKPEIFENQLRSVIKNKSITIAEYENITKQEFDSEEEFYDWLIELWHATIVKPL